MDKSQCFELGYIERSHGVDGAFVAVFDVDQPQRYHKIDALFIERGAQLVPYLVRHISTGKGNKFVISVEGVRSEVEAMALKGSVLYLPEAVLPKLKPDQFYFHELVGCKVEDAELGSLGTITEIFSLPNQTLMAMDWQGSEVLIPVHDDIVKRLDRTNKVVKTALPEGLLEVYLQPEEPQSHAN
jgi:16S rRNA processing protein RimM